MHLLLDDSLCDVRHLRGLSGPWLARESPCLLVSLENLYDANFRGSAPYLGQILGNFHIAIPQMPVVENPQHCTVAASREQVRENIAALTGITLATTPETKLSHLHDNDQSTANVPVNDPFERYYNRPYGRICMTGYVQVHARRVPTKKYRLTYGHAYISRR